jgi:hypothetical protein
MEVGLKRFTRGGDGGRVRKITKRECVKTLSLSQLCVFNLSRNGLSG